MHVFFSSYFESRIDKKVELTSLPPIPTHTHWHIWMKSICQRLQSLDTRRKSWVDRMKGMEKSFSHPSDYLWESFPFRKCWAPSPRTPLATTPALADPAFHILLLASVLAPHDPASHWEPSLQMTALLRGPSLVRKFGGRRYIMKLEKPLAWRSSETGAEKVPGKQPGLEMTVWPSSCMAHLVSVTWLGHGKGSSRTQGSCRLI